MSNFEKNGTYDLAEDCYIGSMEMQRLDHTRPLFVRIILTIYLWASTYGSSYSRAFAVLIALIVLTGLLLALPPVGLAVAQTSGGPRLVFGWRLIQSGFSMRLKSRVFNEMSYIRLPLSWVG